jgi:hypothetical protein
MHRSLLWLVFPILLLVFSCADKDDAHAVRSLIEKSANLAEQHHIADLMRLTVEDFKALPGDHDARSVRGILFAAFKRYGRFDIHYPRPTVEMDGPGSATALVYFVVVSKDRSFPGLKDLYNDPIGWIEQAGEKADPYQLRLDLVKVKSEWRVRQAHLERFRRGSFI